MARLSNFLRPGDAAAPEPSPATIVCRPARRHEIEDGLRLILAGPSGPADDETVLDFLAFAVQRRIDVNDIWLALRGHAVVWALLPLVSPGRTMLLFTPGRLFKQTPPQAVRLLTDAVCAHYRRQQIALAQLLLEPRDRPVLELYRRAAFEHVAELVYLHRQLRSAPAAPRFPDGWELVGYTDRSHALFADAIARSYARSLDCPALNGRRTIDDVIAGHRATGNFDPSMWFALSEGGRGRGVLLLNPAIVGDSVELVYLGLSEDARGRGIGDELMRLAAHATLERRFRDLTLAVDARNAPAMKLYHRHGLKRVGSRVALVRDLERAVPPPAPPPAVAGA